MSGWLLHRTRARVAERDETIQQVKDLRRSIDYLETRSTSITSVWLTMASVGVACRERSMTALEKRFKAAVLVSGGCNNAKVLPEADPMNFAPRVKLPC